MPVCMHACMHARRDGVRGRHRPGGRKRRRCRNRPRASCMRGMRDGSRADIDERQALWWRGLDYRLGGSTWQVQKGKPSVSGGTAIQRRAESTTRESSERRVANVIVSCGLATPCSDLDNSAEPRPQAKGVLHLASPPQRVLWERRWHLRGGEHSVYWMPLLEAAA